MVELCAKLTGKYNEVISVKFKQLCNACKPNTLVKKIQSLHLAIVHDSRHLKVGNTLKNLLKTTTTKKEKIISTSKSDFMNLLKCRKKSTVIYHF